MLIFQSIFLISILLTANAQWYIKKTYRTKFMNYPNPGKRSLPEEQRIFAETDCEMPYSQLHSYEQKSAWLLLCSYKKLALKDDDNVNDLEFGLIPSKKLTLYKKGSSYGILPDIKDFENSLDKYLFKSVRRVIKS